MFALAGILLERVNLISSRSFIRPAIFDLELEWTVGVGDWGGRENVLILVVFHKLQSTKTLLPSEVLVNSSAYHIFVFVCLFVFKVNSGTCC